MPRTPLWPPVLAIVVLLAIGTLPGSSWARDTLWRAVRLGADEVGLELSHDALSGNLWRGVTLSGLQVRLGDSQLKIAELSLRWSWARLWAREVLVSGSASGVAGELDGRDLVGQLQALAVSGTGGTWLRAVWQEVEVEVGELSLAGVPLSLPGLAVRDLRGDLSPDAWQLTTTLATPEGSLSLALAGVFAENRVEGELLHADVRIARGWWSGLEAGRVTGEFEWLDGHLQGLFAVTDGALQVAGVTADAIEGAIVWSGSEISAALQGAGSGGQLTATVDLDLATPRWQVTGAFEVPLATAGRSGFDLLGWRNLPTAEAGSLWGTVAAHGWREADVAVTAAVDGMVLAAPLTLPSIHVGFATGEGVRAEAVGGWGGGSVELALTTVGADRDLSVRVSRVDLGVATLTNLDISEQDGTDLRVGARGTLLEVPWEAAAALAEGSWSGTARLAGWGDATLADGVLRGGGLTPGLQWAQIELQPQPWTVAGELGAAVAVRVGASEAWLGADGTVGARIEQVLGWGEGTALLSGTFAEEQVQLSLVLPSAGALMLTGDRSSLALRGSGPASAAAAALHPELAIGGALELQGEWLTEARWQAGGGPTGELTWTLAQAGALAFDFAAGRVRAEGLGLALALDAEQLVVRGDGTPLTALWLRDDLALRVDGDAVVPLASGGAGAGAATLSLAAVDGVAADLEVRVGPSGGADWSLSVSGGPVPVRGSGSWSPQTSLRAVVGDLRIGAGERAGVAWPAALVTVDLSGDGPLLAGRDGIVGAIPGSLAVDLDWNGEVVAATYSWREGPWNLDLDHPALALRAVGEGLAWELTADSSLGSGRELAVVASGEGLTGAGRWRLADVTATGASEPHLAAAGALVFSESRASISLEPAAGGSTGALEVAAGDAGLSFAAEAIVSGVAIVLSGAGGVAAGTEWQLTGTVGELPVTGRWAGFGQDASELTLGEMWRWQGGEGRGVLQGPQGTTARIEWWLEPQLQVTAALELLGYTGEASLTRPEGSGWSLQLAVADSRETRALAVSGSLAPLDLAGTLKLAVEPYPIRVLLAPQPLLRWGDLDLAWAAGALRLAGRSHPGQLPWLAVSTSDLAWSPAAGWRGEVALASDDWGAGWSLAGSLSGDGDLSGASEWRWAGSPAGLVRVSLPADPRAGAPIDVDLLLAHPADLPTTLRVSGPLRLDGSGLNGDLQVSAEGDWNAIGSLTISATEATLEIAGDQLRASGYATARAVALDAEWESLPLARLLPGLSEPRASGRASLTGSPTALAWALEGVRLDSREASLTGRAQVLFGPDSPASVTGELTGHGIVPLGDATGWWGEASIAGSLSDPLLSASLRFEGVELNATADVTWEPMLGRGQVRAFGEARAGNLDLDLALAETGFSGGGTVVLGGSAWQVQGVGGELWWTAPQAPDVPLVRAQPAARVATVELAVAELLPGSGSVTGTIAWPAPGALPVELEWRNLSLAGVELGSGTLTGDLLNGFSARGSHPEGGLIAGAFNLRDRDWVLALDDLSTELGGRLSLAGSSVDRANGTPLSGRWQSGSRLLPADLLLASHVGPEGWEVSVAGELFGVGEASGRLWPRIDLSLRADDGESLHVSGDWSGDRLRWAGGLAHAVAGVTFEVAEPGRVTVSLPGFAGGLQAELPALPLLRIVEQFSVEGWSWDGFGDWQGRVQLGGLEGGWLTTPEVALTTPFGRWTLSGSLAADGGSGALGGDLHGLSEPLLQLLAWDPDATVAARWEWNSEGVTVTAEAPWRTILHLSPATQSAALSIDWQPNDRDVWRGDLRYEAGWFGGVEVESSGVLVGERTGVRLVVVGGGEALSLSGSLFDDRGSATITGRWDGLPLIPTDWLPTPHPSIPLAADVRLLDLDLARLIGNRSVAGRASGSLTLRQGRLLGRVTSDTLTLAGAGTQATLDVVADLGVGIPVAGQARLQLPGADAAIEFDAVGISGLLQLERYPLGEWVGLAIPGSDVVLEGSGAIRGRWSWGDGVPRDLRVALDPVRWERAGSPTSGRLAFDWDGERLQIGQASFEGEGTWQLRGEAGPNLVDLELLASGADFSPFLGLVPGFVDYGVVGRGDLVLRAQGTWVSPDLVVGSDNLSVQVAGVDYHLSGLRFRLHNDRWLGRSEVRALDPIRGSLLLTSDGVVRSWTEADFTLAAQLTGDLEVPYLGSVEALTADLAWIGRQPAELTASGVLGTRFQVEGTLAPLDLRGSGRALNLVIPFLAIAEATADADLRLREVPNGVSLSGAIDASAVRIDLASRALYLDQVPARAEGAPAEAAAENPLGRVGFEALRITAPQRVAIAEPFASGDAAIDLTLDGTAADPRLSGTVRALRGTVRFAGRELEIVDGVATFDPTAGVYPSVRVEGRAPFEKARVAGPGVRFVSPAGPTFDVTLLLEGEMFGREQGFSLNLEPTLSSNAAIEAATGPGVRPLTENELLTLLTLGRVELDGGTASAVAQSALDTAIDLLLASELQAALSSALGVDVVELRTTTIATLISGSDPFGVSLRLGGYLSDEVFASYQLATSGGDGFASEVALAYQLGPVAFDISGRFDIVPGGESAPASLALGARYGLASGWDVEFGFDLSTQESTTRIGVSWRW